MQKLFYNITTLFLGRFSGTEPGEMFSLRATN